MKTISIHFYISLTLLTNFFTNRLSSDAPKAIFYKISDKTIKYFNKYSIEKDKFIRKDRACMCVSASTNYKYYLH